LVNFKQSPCHGDGLIAEENIEADTFVWNTHLTFPEIKGLWINITPNCLYNHSKKYENCKIVTSGDVKSLYTIKKIKAGEELFIDYTKDRELEQPEEQWEK